MGLATTTSTYFDSSSLSYVASAPGADLEADLEKELSLE